MDRLQATCEEATFYLSRGLPEISESRLNLPIPQTYTQVVVATGTRWNSSRARSPKTYKASLLALVILLLRRARCLAISAEHLLLPVRGLRRSPGSQSTSSITTATHACRLLKRPG